MDGLEAALIMDSTPGQELKNYLLKFPLNCDVTVVCPKTVRPWKYMICFYRSHQLHFKSLLTYF